MAMTRPTIVWAAVLAFPLAAMGQGTFRVHFDQATYAVTPQGTVAVGVVIDPTPSAGLFSFGLKVTFNEALARIESATAVSVPPPIDFNGVAGPGALRVLASGSVGVKGTVDFFVSPIPAYDGALLATITLRDLSGRIGTASPLNLEIFRTLGPSESVFVDGAGTVLDERLEFGAVTLTVIPEPATALLLALTAALGCALLPKRSRLSFRPGQRSAGAD